MRHHSILQLPNAQPAPLSAVPDLPTVDFRRIVVEAVQQGQRISALFGKPGESDAVHLYAVLADDAAGVLSVLSTRVRNSYSSLTPDCPQAQWFEREIAEQWGILPAGHTWLKPIRFHRSYRPGHDVFGKDGAAITPGVTDYFQVKGSEIHEVGVGPVHAGVIEPGHFRFQCHGETVLHLEIELGYQHRGLERALVGGPTGRTIHYMETAAGDTTIGHATAYCHAMEALGGLNVPPRAQAIRGIALELERIANHVGDLGALAGDVGYLPTASFCGRLRGDYLNMTALLCGSRFGRGLTVPGGVNFDVDDALAGDLLKRLAAAEKDTNRAVNLLWDTPSVTARFEETGTISERTGRQISLVGPPGRACGMMRDVRQDFPSGIYRFAQIPVSTWDTGDVFARAYVRHLEVGRSIAFVRDQLSALPSGLTAEPMSAAQPDSLAVSLVEGWRGEICHVAMTDASGRIALYKIVDPSFHNWFGLAVALRDQQISDFPLCNKSFNLSYCGHDL